MKKRNDNNIVEKERNINKGWVGNAGLSRVNMQLLYIKPNQVF